MLLFNLAQVILTIALKSTGLDQQGSEFAHRFFEQIAQFLWAKARKSDSLLFTSESLFHSFANAVNEHKF